MNIYYYFLFRLYWSFRDFSKEGHKMALVSTGIFSSVFLCFIFYVLILFTYYWTDDAVPRNYNFLILVFGFVVFMANYYLVIKKEFFLRKSFKKENIGGFLVLLSVALVVLLFAIGANKNREKLHLEKDVRESVK